MSIDISSIAYAIRTATAASASPIKLGQAQQCVAAALGYKSLAALQASGEHSRQPAGDGEFTHVVVDTDTLTTRATQLELPYDKHALASIIRAAFSQKAPAVTIHSSLQELEDALRELIASRVRSNAAVAGQVHMADSDGISSMSLPFDIDWRGLSSQGNQIVIPVDGHVSMAGKGNRPDASHCILVKANLWLSRQGPTTYASSVELVTSMLTRSSVRDDDAPTRVSLVEALAELLGLSFDEAEPLVDAEVQPIDGNDDAVYGYIFDFANTDATKAVRRKIEKRLGSLNVRVGPDFFERVHHRDANPRRHYVHGDQHEANTATYFCANCDLFVEAEHFEDKHPGRAEERYFSSLQSWQRRPARLKINTRRPTNATNVLATIAHAQKQARENSRSDFHRWLERQTDRDDPIGDLARDVKGDKAFPLSESSNAKIRTYLKRIGAANFVLTAFDQAWNEFAEYKV